MAKDSALSALSAAALATLLFVVVPEVWASSVPEDIRRTAAPYLQPFLEGAHTLAGPFRPLLNNGWGLALLGLAGFTVLFAAVLSARTLSPRST